MTDFEKEMYERALFYATDMHRGQTRKGGGDYILHPVAVASRLEKDGYPYAYIVTGLFHDLLEDTPATEKIIRLLGGDDVLTAVKTLTKTNYESEQAYIDAVKANPIAFAVKRADRLHNLQCANRADIPFIKQYIEETETYFSDFGDEIKEEVKKLKAFLKEKEAEQ